MISQAHLNNNIIRLLIANFTKWMINQVIKKAIDCLKKI